MNGLSRNVPTNMTDGKKALSAQINSTVVCHEHDKLMDSMMRKNMATLNERALKLWVHNNDVRQMTLRILNLHIGDCGKCYMHISGSILPYNRWGAN